jgi:hypothetical protein
MVSVGDFTTTLLTAIQECVKSGRKATMVFDSQLPPGPVLRVVVTIEENTNADTTGMLDVAKMMNPERN